MKDFPLHFRIIIGLVLGLLYALLSIWLEWPIELITQYIKPLGAIFVNILKIIAIPLVLSSLIMGIVSLGNTSKLSHLGGRTIGVYLVTTILATAIGLCLVNLLKPGEVLPMEMRGNLMSTYLAEVDEKTDIINPSSNQNTLQFFVGIFPFNSAIGNNRMVIPMIVFSIVMGILLVEIPRKQCKSIILFFKGFDGLIIKLVDYVMIIAPFGVFALIASLIVELTSTDARIMEMARTDIGKALHLLYALFWYCVTVLIGLTIMIITVYPAVFTFFTKKNYFTFFSLIRPAQLLAFSTSSSSATLPITMKCVKKKLGVSEEVSNFVLPLGATINMDGTSLYQSVAAIFIAQALGIDLSISSQLLIVLTATLASIGSAGVPGAGMIMLAIVLESVGIPTAGIALVIVPDRILDMCRTVVNVTGDATVAMIVENQNKSEQIIAES